MDAIAAFLAPSPPSLKICGVTSTAEAQQLAELGVPALGINFWPQSKRSCSPEAALTFLPSLRDQIVRVGVFVNNAPSLAWDLLAQGALDVVQLHGDEEDAEVSSFLAKGIPIIRALTLPDPSERESTLARYQALLESTPGRFALLLDAHAPGLYGGTGEQIDWASAREFIQRAAPLPVLLAGGIVPENALQALQTTHPAGLDVASGAEHSPGRKDFQKVSSLLATTQTSVSLP